MARIVKGLTNTQVERAKYTPNGTNVLNDGKGLFLELYPTGAKKWRFRYDRPISKARTKFNIGDHTSITLANEILTYAMNAGAIPFNPCLSVKNIYSFAPAESHPHIESAELPLLLTHISESKAQPRTKDLILFQLLTMVRPSEASNAEWAEFDLENKVWTIPAEKMKMKYPHKVPLSSQTIRLLQHLQAQTGHKRFVFASRNKINEPMNSQSVNKALVDMGYKGKQDAHGLRSIGRTYIGEKQMDGYEVLEMCIAHKVGTSTGKIYDKADFFEQRIQIMQAWADFVEQCAKGTNLIK